MIMRGMNIRALTRLIFAILGFVLVAYVVSIFLMHNASEEIVENENIILGDNTLQTDGSNTDTSDEQLAVIKLELENVKNKFSEDISELTKNINVMLQLISNYTSGRGHLTDIHALLKDFETLKEKIDDLQPPKKSDLFNLRNEIDELKIQISTKQPIKAPKDVPKDSKFLMIFPGYGPNNQYVGMMDSMFLAKKLNRIFARPDFFLHAINDLDSIRSFEFTFEPGPISQYMQTVSLQEYTEYCDGKIDTVVWLRNPDIWMHVVKIYLRHAGLSYTNVIYTPNKNDLWFASESAITNYFAKLDDHKCIALCFPYMSVYSSPERSGIIKYINHSKYIKEVVKSALKDIGVTPDKLFAIHWRFGEDSCAWYKSPDPEYDFCWGTTIFHYAKVSDVLKVLIDFIHTSQVTHVYLAVAAHYLDPGVMDTMHKEFKANNISYFRAKDVPSLQSITDNYYLSLVEQEISATAHLFCRSDSSSWSDFVVSWVQESARETPKVVSLAELLENQDMPYATWNREADVEKLLKYRRPDDWWKNTK